MWDYDKTGKTHFGNMDHQDLLKIYFPGDKPLPKPLDPPKSTANRKKLFMLGLSAALGIASTIPRIELSYIRGLQNHLCKFKKQRMLNMAKLSNQELIQVRESLAQLPTELIHARQVLPVITDIGASQTCGGQESAFVPGSSKLYLL